MTSLSGTKERSVTSRNRKYGMTDTSPTKSATFSPETWYRKAYEESRTGGRPTPEGAGSMPSSTGTPSPGSGTSSPGSFSGSPGTISPGIGTESPGSLGGSPGFGTGSPGSGSGSSPGSERERGIWCDNCNARLTELKRQALKLLIPGPYSSKDPSYSLLLHDQLQVPNSSRRAWNEQDGRCDVCSTQLTQLKQEAVHMVLALDQWDQPPGSPPSRSTRGGPSQGSLASRDWVSAAHSPNALPPSNPSQGAASVGPTFTQAASAAPAFASQAPSAVHQGGHLRHGSKPSSLGVGLGVERKNGSPAHGSKTNVVQAAQLSNSPGNTGAGSGSGAVLSTGTLQAHQYMSRNNGGGVTLYPYQITQMISDTCREGLTETSLNTCRETEAALNRYNADRPAPSPSQAPPTQLATTTASTTTSAAASFFARAAQKLNLSSKKKKPRPMPPAPLVCGPPLFPTNFSGTLQTAPPPAPPCLLRAATKVKDTPGLGKVKVMVRVCPVMSSDAAESSSFLKVDTRKKQVSIMDPTSNQTQGNTSQKRGGANQIPPKMFAFDAAFPHDASQAEVCAGTVAEVIQSVVNGADGCVFCFGHSKLGKSYTMIGADESLQTLGIIPCAISWLFKLINERKEKTGARFSVRVSAVEVWGKDENLKDLLSEVATGSLQDGQSPGVYLCEDPICGMQLQNQSELRAPTPEKAAFFLDAAIAARYSSRANADPEEHRNSHMLFTLHIYQYRMEKTGKGGMSGGRSRLHLIDLGSCVKVPGGEGMVKTRDISSSASAAGLCLSLSALGNVILALVNGSKHIPYKDSKLTMLLRELLGNMNCRTTMIAHISSLPSNFSDTLSTIQIASRVLRIKKKKTKVTMPYTSSSSGGESSCEEGRMRRPTHLRPFHSRSAANSDLPLLHLPRDPDDYSSSEQSCDTVIYVGPSGGAISDRELTDNEGPPEVVPIIHPLLQSKESDVLPTSLPQPQQQTFLTQAPPIALAAQPLTALSQPLTALSQPLTALSQPVLPLLHPLGHTLLPVPEEGAECLKCNTFAELQERLECIDGSEEEAKFPFEEEQANSGIKPDTLDSPGPEAESTEAESTEAVPTEAVPTEAVPTEAVPTEAEPTRVEEVRVDDKQLQEIREVVEEAELAQTMIKSLSVTVSSGSGHMNTSPLQKTQSAGLQDSRESLSMGSSNDGKPRPLGSPRLGVASLTRTSDYRPPSSPSQRCKVYTQKGVMPGTPPLSCQSLSAPDSLAVDSGRSSTESLLQPECLSRTSPVGMSPKVLKRTNSSSTSLGSAETLCDDFVPQIPLDGHGETPNPCSTPADPLGEDELVFTLGGEEQLELQGLLESGGRPASIMSFSSDCSVTAMVSGSRHVSSISSVSELERYENNTTIVATSTGVVTLTADSIAGVIAMAEISMAKLRAEGEVRALVSSQRSSVSSWLSELSTGSHGNQSQHSTSQAHRHGEEHEEAFLGPKRKNTPDSKKAFFGDEKGRESECERSTPTSEMMNKPPTSLGKTTIALPSMQMLGASTDFIPFKTNSSGQPCVVVKPIVMLEPPIISSPTSNHLLLKDPARPSSTPTRTPVLSSMSLELSFDDPWMKRDGVDVRPKVLVCEGKPEKRVVESLVKTDKLQGDRGSRGDSGYGGDRHSSSSGEAGSSPDSYQRVVDGCEVVLVSPGDCLVTPIYSADILHTGSLPRGWHRLHRHDDLEDNSLHYATVGGCVETQKLGVTTSTPCSPRGTLDWRVSSGKQGLFSRQKGIPPLPPVRKSSLDQKNRAAGPLSPLHAPSHGFSFLGSTVEDLDVGGSNGGKQKGCNVESSRLFSAKLEQLANRTNSLGRTHGAHSPHYNCLSLERGESLSWKGTVRGGKGDTTMPRIGRSLTRGGSVSSSPNRNGSSPGSSPQSSKSNQSKISAVGKLLMTSPKTRSLSASSTKTLSFSTKSLPQAVNRSSSLPPIGKTQTPHHPQTQPQNLAPSQGQNQSPSSGSWSTQSLSRSRGGSLAAKLPLRAVNGRISELLQGSGGSRSTGHNRVGGSDTGEEKVTGVGGSTGGAQGEERPAVVHTLPSPYSKITAPRRPHRCSSGHASDNSSVLSGELPPAMGKTALFYHSGGSSGYESMLRDSEATGSTSSALDSMSEHSSATSSSRRSLTSYKKRNNSTGTQRRRLIPSLTLDSPSPVRKPAISPGARWVDGPLRPAPRGTTEPFEIKVYEIDDVERLQKRKVKDKEVVYFSAKLKILEHRQQRISEVRAKYDWLKKELEQTKQHLMVEPEKWTNEFDVQQTFEEDSLEYLEALEVVTERLETRVNFCKAHLMMVTCFDVTCRRR